MAEPGKMVRSDEGQQVVVAVLTSQVDKLKQKVGQLEKSHQEHLARIRVLEDKIRNQVGVSVADQSHRILENKSWAPDLPKEILTEILKYVGKDEPQTVLNCRLVHPVWKDAIDTCPGIMRKLVLDIPFIETFLASTIVSKVKAVRFKNALNGDKARLEKFFKAIGENVEDVTFKFGKDTAIDKDLVQFGMMFSALMGNSRNLRTFHIASTSRSFLRKLTTEELVNVGSSLRTISINIGQCGESEVNCIQNFIHSLPMVSTIEFYNSGYECVKQKVQIGLIDVIDEYMKTYDSLKKVEVRPVMRCFACDMPSAEKLLLTAVNQQLDINLVGFSCIGLSEFIKYASENGHQIPAPNNKYLAIKDSYLSLPSDDISKVGYFGNLRSLDVKSSDEAQDFQFLSKLINLKELELDGSYDQLLSLQNIYLPSLIKLRIYDEDWELVDSYEHIHSCFPNLEELKLQNVDVSSNMICSLVKLQKLVSLELDRCRLRDSSFNQLVTPTWADKETTEKVPTIAAFKNLRSLTITDFYDYNAAELTDSCLINGISYNKTLKNLKLGCPTEDEDATAKFTWFGLRAIVDGGYLKLDSVKDTNGYLTAIFSSNV